MFNVGISLRSCNLVFETNRKTDNARPFPISSVNHRNYMALYQIASLVIKSGNLENQE